MKAGDHILIPRPGGAEHGIDVGDRTAIVFEPGKGPRRVRLDLDGDRPAVVTHAERAYAPKQVVARAFSRFSESAYSAMFESSEAFAVWCKTGRPPAAARGRAPAAARAAPETLSRARAASPARPARKGKRPAAKAAARAGAAAPRSRKAAASRSAPAPGKKAAKKAMAKGRAGGRGRPSAPKAPRAKGKPAPKRGAAARARVRARGR